MSLPMTCASDVATFSSSLMLKERWSKFVEPKTHPSTPILLVEDRNYADGFLITARRERNETNHAAMRAVYDKLRQDKVPGLLYLKADELLSADGEDTIDGSHPTDLGFVRHADAFERVLKKVLR